MFVLKRKQVIVAIIFCMVLVAGYINWAYQPEEPAETASADETKYLGEAEMVNAEAEKSPVTVATETRNTARNKAKELLDEIINNPSADEASKASALSQLTQMAKDAEKEGVCEGILNSKGMGEMIVYIAEGAATVTVNSDRELTQEDIVKITDVILSNTEIQADKIKISKMQ